MGCASGILEVTYGANELNLVETADFSELNDITVQSGILLDLVDVDRICYGIETPIGLFRNFIEII